MNLEEKMEISGFIGMAGYSFSMLGMGALACTGLIDLCSDTVNLSKTFYLAGLQCSVAFSLIGYAGCTMLKYYKGEIDK